MERETRLFKALAVHVLDGVTKPHYLVAHCLEKYKQHEYKSHEHDGYRLNCLNPSA